MELYNGRWKQRRALDKDRLLVVVVERETKLQRRREVLLGASVLRSTRRLLASRSLHTVKESQFAQGLGEQHNCVQGWRNSARLLRQTPAV